METVVLLGADDVARAGQQVAAAGAAMRQAADIISFALEAHQRFLEAWLSRAEAAIEQLGAK